MRAWIDSGWHGKSHKLICASGKRSCLPVPGTYSTLSPTPDNKNDDEICSWAISDVAVRTGPSQSADAVHLDADQHRLGALHSAIVGHHLQDVIVILLIVERFRTADDAYWTQQTKSI